ncbi:MAG: hypothetical protein JWO95_3429 [Verrucomicrobiales bacterium]|nr:hypothetical protein [Verrucomicrobiales bacterium]
MAEFGQRRLRLASVRFYLQSPIDHLERDYRIGGDERGIFLPPTTGVVLPGAVGFLKINEFCRDGFAPVDGFAVGESKFVDVANGQAFGHEMEIVVETLLAHRGIFVDGPVILQPIHDGGDARVVLLEVCIYITEQAGVTDGTIGAQSDAAIGVCFGAGFAFAGCVDETAFVFCRVGNPRLFVVGREVLATLNEMDYGGPVEVVGGIGFVVVEMFCVIQRFQRGERVVHVGVVVLVSVTDAAVVRGIDFAFCVQVDLLAVEPGARAAEDVVVSGVFCSDEGHHANGGVVIFQFARVDGAVGFDVGEDEFIAVANGWSRAALESGSRFAHVSFQRERGDGGVIGR